MENHVANENPSGDVANSSSQQSGNVDDMLKDPEKLSEILRKLGLPNPSVLTPSGRTIGGGGLLPPMWCPFPMFPPWNRMLDAHVAGPSWQQQPASTVEARIGKSNALTEFKKDTIELLDEKEVLELVKFDPTVDAQSMLDPTKGVLSFLEKHFNRCVTEDERGSILPNFPKPTTPVLQTPRLDDDVKEQLKKKGKDPHFGQEKVLFKLQYLLLDVSGPLMCLWSYLTNPDAEVASEQILLLIQHALVLLSSTSHVMILERRKIT